MTRPSADQGVEPAPASMIRTLVDRISRLEIAIAAAIAVLMLVLIVIEPNILEAPFENARTLLFTFGGTLLAGLAFVAMLFMRIPPAVRVVLLVVPFAIVNWWLLSPYFIDDVVDETFTTSISSQLAASEDAAPVPTTAPVEAPAEGAAPADDAAAADDASGDQTVAPADGAATDTTDATADGAAAAPAASTDEPAAEEPAAAPEPTPEPEPTPVPTGPVLLGAGQFVGLAGHSGTGDAGIFQNPDGSLILRFENFDIENGPDLEVYLVPGADQTSLPDGSIHLGALKGNIGDQNYELPPGTVLAPGPWTALVWCEAFSVEFVGATVNV